MEELGLRNLEHTNIVLQVVDQQRVKPLEMLQGIKTMVAALNSMLAIW